ncbi:Rhodanese-related sulfurtransferase [Halorubrum aquaticum]|uniref:Rhodanese-related sulfurtransferase n=1 Tax=Halorubrum aquaticum TaxID=387340 RepID=A0A1I3B7P5_9EURY|nr:rhodanese-like domain-containing protein [Halorubrum aquaticum]SFH58304.1 Rhodanese-related sulfurtransferase [Halorubrum aquaticum]
MNGIRPDELDERLGGGSGEGSEGTSGDEPFVLDVRPADAYESGAIDGSHNLPVYEDLRGGDESALRARLDEVPRDREVITVCKMGIVAKRATNVLEEEGYDARTLAGGMSGWNGYRVGSLGYKIRSLWWRIR